ncbi:MAG: hypothetical protein KIS85_08160 [Anaerolineales bacterium]|nr:hypothetical protein [Anaerolineales bacterium]
MSSRPMTLTAPRPDAVETDWEQFHIRPEDLEFLSAYLLEEETPLGPEALAAELIRHRIQQQHEQAAAHQAANKPYLPKERYAVGDRVSFPALDWTAGKVSAVRPAKTLGEPDFEVITVEFEDGAQHDYAAGLEEHILNQPPEVEETPEDAADAAVAAHAARIAPLLAEALRESPEFVYIAGRWFPRALIVDVDSGQLNVAEALLDMASGGPLPTAQLLGEVELPSGLNPRLAEFSLDLALQEDPRFDEVGPSGEVAWFLRRLEPEPLQKPPLYLHYEPLEHDRAALTEDMLALEAQLDDELTSAELQPEGEGDQLQVALLYPHWRVGSLPLTRRLAALFPSAYESPRVRFDFVDAANDGRFQGWVDRSHGYVVGLHGWYQARGLMPGAYVQLSRGEQPGEVLVATETHRSSKEWVRTALVGADGGVVYAMLKQPVEASFDERMMVQLPADLSALDAVWQRRAGKPVDNLAQIVAGTMRELAKLNPQNHVHAVELYSALNLVLRCPPAPLLALLASRPQFEHVGHLHFRLAEQIADA